MNSSKKTRYTQYQLETKLIEIREYQNNGMTKDEISELTGIPIRTLTYYIKKISEKDKEIWDDMAKESLEGRALKIKNYYEKIAKIAERILDDENSSIKDIEIAAKLVIACHKNIYEMLKHGALKLPKIVDNQIENNEYYVA